MSGPSDGGSTPKLAVVGPAIQNLAARRVARIFVPLVGLLLVGALGAVLREPPSVERLFVTLGAAASGAAVVLQALAAVRRGFGTPTGRWMRLATVAGVFPYLYGVYTLVLRGVRPLAGLFDAFGWWNLLEGVAFVLLSGRLLWALWGLLEVQRLAVVMARGEHSR